jgi:hypothetical protein
MRRRIKDKRVLSLVKAFLKAGVLTEGGDHEETYTGTPQGGSATRKGARCEWIALVGGPGDAGDVISGQCPMACPRPGVRRW